MIELDVLSAADRAANEDAAESGKRPWRSAGDRTHALGYAARRNEEFLSEAPVTEDDTTTSRRSFLKVMGASAALAGLSGCRRPVETIVPYVRKPLDVTPGIPTYFATAMPLGGVLHALLVQNHEGRPTKVEGNPEHPVSKGATDAFAQASVLQLYDPDRSRSVYVRSGEAAAKSDWATFVAEASQLAAQATTLRVAVIAEPTSSPTLLAQRQQMATAYPNARWITLGAYGDDNQALGTQAALGQSARPLYRFSNADVIVSFDADFLGGDDPNSVWNNREYAAGRRVDTRGSMSRLYVAESTMTITGGMADHRLRMKAGAVPFFAAAVSQGLGVSPGVSATVTPEMKDVVDAIVQDVQAAAGKAAFVAGAHQAPEVHALVAALNGQFGSAAVSYLPTGEPAVAPVAPQVQSLVRDMNAGAVDVVLMLGTNPAYTLPESSGFAAALAKVKTSIHVGLYRDESGQAASWHVPQAHYLESWGDGRAYDGTLSVIQPMIAPIYEAAHSEIEVLNVLLTGAEAAGYEVVRQTMSTRLSGNFEDAWRTVLHDGFALGTAFAAVGSGGGAANLSALRAPAADAMELVFRTSPTLYDGQFSNVSWMQETPHPVTKTTWDPIALVSPATAEAQGFATEERKGKAYSTVITLKGQGDASLTVPVWVQPGQPDNSITVYLGYGRDLASDRVISDRGIIERVFDKDVNVYRPGPIANGVAAELADGPLAARAERIRPLGSASILPAVTATVTGGDYMVVSTQDHGSMEGRDFVRVATLDTYRAEPDFAQEKAKLIENTPWEEYPPLWGPQNSASEDPRLSTEALYHDNQWGMTIDLNACTGCNACVTACQSENNVPVVGKDQVSRGREMHWLRVDRYYVGDEADPGMVTQPMMCVHCENAPCEQVCPVNATSHSPDGLNEMTYNRCIGTRYCANNCPYKVRRYNFYNWTKVLPKEVWMQSNPYVTVRYRGVMEKCTFCVQRIRQTQQVAHIEDRTLEDGEVVTACQQACPAEAIVFGDLNNASSAIAKSKTSPRNYAVLAELAVKPRLTYLARLRNPHPSLATPFDAEAEA